jgi:transaldolase / glucose-6-phosphate isomerase
LQITADDINDIAVPGQKASFGTIKSAQARADFDELVRRGRRSLRLHIKGNVADGLSTIGDAMCGALT